MMESELNKLRTDALAALQQVSDAKSLEQWRTTWLGRKGSLAQASSAIATQPETERANLGKLWNTVKHELEQALQKLQQALQQGSVKAAADLTLMGPELPVGSLHPLRHMQRRIQEVFMGMGYEVLHGPEIELAKYNFDFLRIPEDHPARDEWDTFYIDGALKSGPNQPLLRTHISPMQVRVMEKRQPPIRFISPGRVFRHEATDASHEANYHYCEGMAIAKGLTFGDLLGTLETFFKTLFGEHVEIRAQPSFFPFVEPGAEILMNGGKGWMEMLGCGMIHPEVLRNMHVDPKEYSGFAFGMGIDRLMMYYYGVPDVRMSYQGDLRFLSQF